MLLRSNSTALVSAGNDNSLPASVHMMISPMIPQFDPLGITERMYDSINMAADTVSCC